MRILLCDPDNTFLQSINPSGIVDLVKIIVPGEAMAAGVFNLACISNDIPEWPYLAQHFTAQGTETYIMAHNISDINVWKQATELGCQGVWAKDKVLHELDAKIDGQATISTGVSRRPLRGQLSRNASTPVLNQTNAPLPVIAKPNHQHQRQQPAAYNPHSPTPPAIVVNRELICFFGADGG
ncbi:hypothetical protein N752_01140 [Desulforamulus aquiferis]|nr:hypothetical protein [Desulforamulus aquiferis]RYD07220.1 hypothetical protein N752_01140 [Desulforamulus aquiferis]